MKSRLFTPGPTPVPESVMLRMAQPIIHHRTSEFREIFQRASENLQYLFQTKQPVLTLTASGTGAMEAALVNTLSPGDEIIYVDGGKFGARWGAIAVAYGITAHALTVEWGHAPAIEDALAMVGRHPNAKAFCFTHSETSTGSYTDVRAMTAALRERFDGLVIVDGITAVGAHEMRFDDWDIDIVVTGSQKGLMIPPGLAFIALSERAWKATETSTLPKFYYSMQKARKNLATWDTPWTPAVTLVIGLGEALEMLRREGVENVWMRHERLARSLRTGVSALGLRLFADPASNAVTSVYLPERADEFYALLKKKYGITAAAGQDHVKGKIFRVSHLGYYDEADMFSVLYAIESALVDVDHPHEQGAGLAAALRSFSGADSNAEVLR